MEQKKNNEKYYINYYLLSLLPNYIFKIVNWNNSIIEFFNLKILNIFYILKNHYNIKLNLFMDLVTVDIIVNKFRFYNIYNILSIKYNTRFLFKTIISTINNSIESVENVYMNINWYERESWDLFGIIYINHSDLRRILNDYGYKGHPLRKDFPLTGYYELKYNFVKKIIVYSPINPLYRFKLFSNRYNWKFI